MFVCVDEAIIKFGIFVIPFMGCFYCDAHVVNTNKRRFFFRQKKIT